MSRQKDIQINKFQLNILLNDEQKDGFNYLLNNGVFCSSCKGICTKGVEVTEIFLNTLNDIMVKGTCKVCNGKVTRIMEFGEDKAFFEKATEFRKAISN